MEQAFSLFDSVNILNNFQNGDGLINREEIELIMGHVNDENWNVIISDCDNDKDGKVFILII